MPNYQAYIKSDGWRARAEQAKERVGHRCQVCNANDLVLHVHHRTYTRLGHEKELDLIVLCEVCHSVLHSDLVGKWRKIVKLARQFSKKTGIPMPKELVDKTEFISFFIAELLDDPKLGGLLTSELEVRRLKSEA